MTARPLLVLLLACSSPPKPPAPHGPPTPAPPVTEQPAEIDPAPPELRLPTTVRPLHHDVELAIDPSTEDFTGKITIEVEITEATKVIWLNQEEITVKTATVTANGNAQTPRIVASKDFMALVLPAPVGPGRAQLAIDYAGKMHKGDGTGIYTAKDGESYYAYTQFESMDAREAFPCFDEPSFKVPWKLAIRTKTELVALANSPQTAETDEGNGWKRVEFAETKPLPSYLVAFAVGPFELVDAGKTRHGVPIRIAIPKGHTKDEVAYPVRATRPLIDLLEDYFGLPYPYEKLDLLACTVFNAGAMENPGLITYRLEALMTKPAEMTLNRQKSYASITAHELAHMWFGDYVTLAWWDDTWLNESFASWMGEKIVDQWQPKWDGAVGMVAGKSGVMGQDSLDTARAIRQPIESTSDVQNAFDGITYGKGEAVLNMIEHHVGADKFQQGVRAYMAKHAWKNATYDDFVAALASVAGDDVKAMFDAFVLQSGVPMVSFELSCQAGKPPTLALAQKRYAPTGSKIDPKRTWRVPVCTRWGAGAATGRDCMVLSTEAAELPLSAKTCPQWVLPNADGLGYYRMLPKGKLLEQLLAKSKVLTLPERVGLLGDTNALVASGDVPNGVALRLVEGLSKDKSRHIVDASIGIVSGIHEMVPDNLRPNYERFIKKLYRARAVELGWRSKKGEDDNTKQLRTHLLGLVAGTAHDPELIKQATALAWKWLDDHQAVEPELVGVVLDAATSNGDARLFERIRSEAKKATDARDRARLLSALGGFTDRKLVTSAMGIVLTDEFELREALGLLQGPFGDPRTRPLAYQFVQDNFDKIAEKLPEPYRPYMAFTFVALCDDAKKPEIEAFWKPRIEKLEGGPRTYAQAIEQLGLCSAQRQAQTPGVVAFLSRQ